MSSINNDLNNNSKNYRPVSILSCFSKVYEKFLLEKFKPLINISLSKFVATYRENYSSSYVLIRLIEKWKQTLDENFVV